MEKLTTNYKNQFETVNKAIKLLQTTNNKL